MKPWVDEVIQMYLSSSMTVAAIAAEVGKHPPQIYKALTDAGVPLRGSVKKAKVDEFEVKLVMHKYEEEGCTAAEIAKDLKIPYQRVLNHLHRNRVEVVIGRNSRQVRTLRKQILTDLRAGMPPDEVATKHGVPLNAIVHHVRGELNRVRPNDFGKVEFFEQVVDEVIRKIEAQLGGQLFAERGVVQLKMDEI